MKKIQVRLFSILIVTALFSFQSDKNNVNIENIIHSMTLEEKIEFIGGYEDFNIRAYEHLGIPEIHLADGPIGVRNFGKSTAFPASINLAASFDKEMAHKVGKAIAMEARSKNAHIMLGPAMNIYRMPQCGRNFEYMGEDPFLAGQLAKEYIIGMQNQGVIACAKHFVANNQDYNRHNVSSDLDERTLHEIYLPAFKTSVTEGKVATVMTSYNLINGIHASEHNYLNNEVLKGEWEFDGFIMSDWVSTYDGLACAKGGLDLEMPSGAMMNKETLIAAIKNGELDEAVIDDKIRRILTVYKRFGLFENQDISHGYKLDKEYVRQVALDAARGGMVLLKNNNGFLPLKKDKIKTIAVIGPNGDPAVTGGGGSSRVDPLHPLSLVDAIKKIAGNEIKVIFEKGISTGTTFTEDMYKNFDFYVYKDGQKTPGAFAEYFNNKILEGDPVYKTYYDTLKLENGDMWDPVEVAKVDFSARFKCYYSPKKSGYYSIGGIGDDGYRIKVDDVQIVELWRNQGPTPGKQDLFLNAGQEYKIEVEYYQAGGGAFFQLCAAKAAEEIKPEEYSKLAIEAAKKADLVIMAVGFNPAYEGEGFDRTFEMPYDQSDFINQIAAVNPNIAVVLNAGGNVEMESWIDLANALLMAWYPGQEGNLAAAEILFGETNPSGKLPASFAYRIEENPCYNSYFDEDGDLRVFYSEGIFMGYRYWDQADVKPRFPFGYGMSYTSFEYSDLSLNKTEISAEDSLKVGVKIKNIGNYNGAEVVQLYVADKESSLPRPVKELKDFEKVALKEGEEITVEFELGKDAFAFYNPETHAWEVEPGEFEILIGSSSADIRQKASVKMK